MDLTSFTDELLKMGGAAQVVGRASRVFAKKTFEKAKKIPSNVSKNALKTVRDFGSPISSTKRGFKKEFKDIKEKGIKGVNLGHAANVAGMGLTAKDAFSKKDPTGKNQSRAHRITAWTGDQIGGFVGARHGLTGAIVGGTLGRRAGDIAGKVTELGRSKG